MKANIQIKGISKNIFRKLFLTRPSITIVIALLLGPAAFLFYECHYSPDISFIIHGSKSAWIMYPYQLDARAREGGLVNACHFFKDFVIDESISREVFLHLKALRYYHLYLNEVYISVDSSQEKNWKKEIQIPITGFLKKGINTIRVEVLNPLGPSLLCLYVEGLKESISTDRTWKVSFGGDPNVQAVLADDTKLYTEFLTVPTPFQALMKKERILPFLFALSVILYVVGHFFFRTHSAKVLPLLALIGITTAWIFIFLTKILRIGPWIGFDSPHHLDYIIYILKNKSFPLAKEGWSMFHPPLFYFLSAGLLEMLRPLWGPVRPFSILKAIPFLCGLGNVWVAYFIGRMIFRNDPFMILLVVLSAGMIPMNIYMSAYVANEPLLAFLISLSFLVALQILRNPGAPLRKMILLGILLSLALLTKITALVFILVISGFLVAKFVLSDRLNLKEVAGRIGFIYLLIVAIAGWYFIRNFISLGNFLVVNWNLPGQLWWQDPGFHTIRYYVGFGEIFKHPYYSGFHSFGDAIYSTFWGDGYTAGLVFLRDRHAMWNYDFMSIVYLLAIPATVIFVLGLSRTIKMAFREKELGCRIIMSFLLLSLYAVGLFILYSTLKIPIYGQAKAFYGLSVIGPISVIFALGWGMINNWLASPRLLAVRAIFYGSLGTLISVVYLSFAG